MEYEKIRDNTEKEIMHIRKLLERPEFFSKEGIAYWEGYVDGLNWVLVMIAEEADAS